MNGCRFWKVLERRPPARHEAQNTPCRRPALHQQTRKPPNWRIFSGNCRKNFSRETAAEILEQIISADGNWPAKRKTALRKPLEKFFERAAFLHSLSAGEG